MDINRNEFNTLSRGLRQVAADIPNNWGHIQNNAYDNELRRYCNIFTVNSLEELERHIARFDDSHKRYYKKRWFVTRCADCDEFLFYVNDNVVHNPNKYDKEWDIIINGHIKFDIKGTVIPESMRDNYDDVIADPSEMIKFFYDKQSRGRRFDMQNRLFIVHHSLVSDDRSKRIRACWQSKERIYRLFASQAEHIHFREYEGCTASVIFIIETEAGCLQYKIDGFNDRLVQV